MLLLYVDDMVITGDDLHGITKFKSFLSQQFEMKDLGYLSYFLGLEVSSDSKGYYLAQAKYITDLISRASLTDSKTTSTPIEANVQLTSTDGQFMTVPRSTHSAAVLHILRYVKGTMDSISLFAHPLNCKHTLILIGLVILQIDVPQLDIVCLLEIPSFLGVVKGKLLLLDLAPKLSTVPLLMPPQNLFAFVGFLRIWG